MPYVVEQLGEALNVLQEFEADGNIDLKKFNTYGEAKYFADNMGWKDYEIKKVDVNFDTSKIEEATNGSHGFIA